MGRPRIPEASRRRLDEVVRRLGDLLPTSWAVTVARRDQDGGTIEITTPDGNASRLSVVTRRRLEPRDAAKLDLPDGPTIVFADWLSPRTRELLLERSANFVDGTGNIDVRLDRPAVSLRTDGARRDPSPKPRGMGPSLNGPRAWALMRTLVEVEPPYTAGELAETLSMDDGYVSRILNVLSDELMIERKPRQAVTAVNWEKLVQQIAHDYALFTSNGTATWIAPGGPDQFLRDVASQRPKGCVLTGSFASNKFVSVVAPHIAVVYTDDAERLAKDLRLLPTRTNANVVTAKPYDPIVYERTRMVDGIEHASIAQVLIDCLTGNARMPSEGEALVKWMAKNEPLWRSNALLDGARRR